MRLAVLGPTQLHPAEAGYGRSPQRPAGTVDLGAPKQRALLAALALYRGQVVTIDTLADLVWAGRPPPAPQASVQAYVSSLRRLLEPDRPPGRAPTVLATATSGYQLLLGTDQVDSEVFADGVTSAHRRLGRTGGLVAMAGASPEPAADEQLRERVQGLLALWRGNPFADLGDAERARTERIRLGELREVAREDRIVTDLRLGRHATVVAELEAATAASPLRERLWALRALALARAGRQAEALAVLAEIRTLLDDELGIEPGAELRDLQVAVLRQDPSLSWPSASVRSASVRSAQTGVRGQTRAVRADDHGPAESDFVGRAAELSRLSDLLPAPTQQARFAVLIGDPGIGKTRLATEFVARIAGAEPPVRVVQTRCSSDDGAPPMWPWANLLAQLDLSLPRPGAASDAPDFAVWTRVVQMVLDAARTQPLVIMIDDLHWADASSLRALRLLVESAHDEPLTLVASWRPSPPPTDALADLNEALIRRDATRIVLHGLGPTEVGRLVSRVLAAAPSAEQVEQLRSRTDGNPFFVLSFARLAEDVGRLETVLAGPEPPAVVSEVLGRRLDRLPTETQEVLADAAVLGRRFGLDLLAAMAQSGAVETLDRLDPALAAGLILDDGTDAFSFAHALVRDTAYARQPSSRRSRRHLRAAEVIERQPASGSVIDSARHWAAAGPAYADRAWRAALVAAESVERDHAYDQAMALVQSAVDLQQVAATRGYPVPAIERYRLQLRLADCCQWAARWSSMIEATEEAIRAARRTGDIRLVAEAAVRPAIGAVWRTGNHGQLQPEIIAALRDSLTALPAGDDPLRARVMIALANELYYGTTFAERVALVDEALAMTERLADDQLELEACLIAFGALWRPDTVLRRRTLAERAVAAAVRLGQDRARTTARTYLACAQAELGEVAAMWETVAEVYAEADRLRLVFSTVVADSLAVAWLAMAGRFAEAEEARQRAVRLGRQVRLPNSEELAGSALVSIGRWQRDWDSLAPVVTALADGPVPAGAISAAVLIRAGRRDDAARLLQDHPIDLDTQDWVSMLTWCSAAEVALEFGDQQLAAACYRRLAPHAGQSGSSGGSGAVGPVDAFLALAATTVGESEAAGRHAQQAAALIRDWQLPLVAEWFDELRARHHF